MSEDLKAIYHRLNEEAWNEGKVDLIDDLLSPDFVSHAPDGTDSSFEEYKQNAIDHGEYWPDGHWATEHIIAEGNTLAAHWIWSGTHTKRVPGIDVEPTGKKITAAGMGFYRFEGRRIAEMWFLNDAISWFQQLGLAQPVGEGEA